MAQAGYTGLYRQPFADHGLYGETLYVITDMYHQELNILILSPGSYMDICRFATAVTFQRVNLFVPTMDALFLSDIFRLVVDLQKIKKTVRWYYPEKVVVSPPNKLFETAQVYSAHFISKAIADLRIEMMPASTEENKKGLYDFRVYDGKSYDLFSLYMTEAKMVESLNCTYDKIHFSYGAGFYGGVSVREMSNHNAWRGKMVPNNFSSLAEFREAAHGMYGQANRIVL